MQRGAILLPIFSLLVHVAIAQGFQRVNGLKAGPWVERYTSARGKEVASGSYAIMRIDSFPLVRKLGNDVFEVQYLGSTPLLFFSGKKGRMISVKNGDWTYFDSGGNLIERSHWNMGINEWRKDFTAKGELSRFSYQDFVNDTSFYLDYIEGRLFKKGFFGPKDKNSMEEIYYAESPLTISNADIRFHINFLDQKEDSTEITLSPKTAITIYAMYAENYSLDIRLANRVLPQFPMYLAAESPVKLKLYARPLSSQYLRNDTIVIKASDGTPDYKIYTTTLAAHLDYKNVSKISSLYLSQSCDQYLYIAPMGTVTGAALFQNGKFIEGFDIKGITPIDLSTYRLGRYTLEITSCNTSGLIQLTLVE
jgi:hypothetical protein